MNENLTIMLQGFAQERYAVEVQKEAIAKLEAKLHETDLYKHIERERLSLGERQNAAILSDAAVRTLALEIYDVEGNKTVCDGVKVGEYKIVTIEDYEAALAWAVEHNMALRLDLAPFKKIVKAGAKPDGVTLATELKVSIAKDLSKYL